MSWAAHNPEKYSEFCRRGMVEMLGSLSPDMTEQIMDGWEDVLNRLLYDLENNSDDRAKELWDLLLSLSHQENANALADHFSSLIP